MHNPIVSIIIPVFNGASFLEDAVHSVQKSSFSNFEILLINDGSSDNSKDLCKNLEKQYANIRFFDFEKNQGLGRVLNFALEKAQGRYICRLNQDDLMLPRRIEKQVSFLDTHPDVVAVGSHIIHFFDDGSKEILKYLETDEEIKKMWHIVGPFSDPSVMYRREVALEVGGYEQSFWPVDDTHMWYKLGMRGKLANIQESLVEVRWHDKAVSVFYFREMAWQIYRVRRWAHHHVNKSPIWVQLFWVFQFLAGMVLTPKMNWKIYRFMKKMIASAQRSKA